MTIYVSELPKSCESCPFYKLDTYVDTFGYQTNSHECVLDGSMITGSCPLQSIAEHAKQVRKEVCEEIKAEFEPKNANHISEVMYPPTKEAELVHKGFKACKERLYKKLEQIQGE